MYFITFDKHFSKYKPFLSYNTFLTHSVVCKNIVRIDEKKFFMLFFPLYYLCICIHISIHQNTYWNWNMYYLLCKLYYYIPLFSDVKMLNQQAIGCGKVNNTTVDPFQILKNYYFMHSYTLKKQCVYTYRLIETSHIL